MRRPTADASLCAPARDRLVEREPGELFNIEFEKFWAVKDPGKVAQEQ